MQPENILHLAEATVIDDIFLLSESCCWRRINIRNVKIKGFSMYAILELALESEYTY